MLETNVMTKAGLKSSDDVTQSLKPYRVKKDHNDLNQLINFIETTMNPFAMPSRETLHNIMTGREVSEDVRDDLLGCQQLGEQWHQDFLVGCFGDESRFDRPIRRRKVKNFTLVASKTTVRGKDEKLLELKNTRDLFGRLLYISSQKKVDILQVLSYPLVEFPLALAHIDGSLTKTDKSQLMKKLEATIESECPSNNQADVTLVDAMFHLHILQDIPETYGEIAKRPRES